MRDFTKYALQELKKATHIETSIKDFFLSSRPGIIYGAGKQAMFVLEQALFFEKKIICAVISDDRHIVSPHINLPVYQIGTIPSTLDKEADVIIAVNEKHNVSIMSALRDKDFAYIYMSNHWNATNEDIRLLWYQCFFEHNGFTRHKNTDNIQYLQYNKEEIIYKLFYPDDPVIVSNMLGTLNDIMLPSLFQNYDYLREGPYEFGNIVLKKDDVVFDLGANVGLFSTVAAAKGCHVYAFEPTPLTLDILKKSLHFYSNAFICPFAVSDKKGKAKFFINRDFVSDKSMGENFLPPPRTLSHPSTNPTFEAIEVNTTTLDDFVEENNIYRVDFIKADIEGAERQMLHGAKHTLARFSPKLALCTYHLPDDPEVMEALILEANPNYIITHKWSKLYAYCG